MSTVVRRVSLVAATAAVSVALTLAVTAPTANRLAPGAFRAHAVTAGEAAGLRTQFGVDLPPGTLCVNGPSSALAGSPDLQLLARIRMSSASGKLRLCSPNPAPSAPARTQPLTGADLPPFATIRVRTASGEVQVCAHSSGSGVTADGVPFSSDGWTCDRPGGPPGTALRAHRVARVR